MHLLTQEIKDNKAFAKEALRNENFVSLENYAQILQDLVRISDDQEEL